MNKSYCWFCTHVFDSICFCPFVLDDKCISINPLQEQEIQEPTEKEPNNNTQLNDTKPTLCII